MKRIFIIVAILLFVMPMSAYAVSNYNDYTYSVTGEAVPSPQTYIYEKKLDVKEKTGKELSAPSDMAHDKDGNLYVIDCENNRLAVFDSSDNFVKEILPTQNMSFADCTGIFVTDEKIFLCASDKGEIYVAEKNTCIFEKLDFVPSQIVGDDFKFKPQRLSVDSTGIIQIVCKGDYNGLITVDQFGKMIGYFGSNKIQASLSVIASQFWKNIFTETQQANMKQTIPVEFTGVCVDNNDFIYTVTASTENSMQEIKKFNPYGNNILKYNSDFPERKIGNGDYGDLRIISDAGTTLDSSFQDIAVDNDGFIYALDVTRGRIFQYSQDSVLVAVFGGIGEQKGTFRNPCALSVYGEKVYVLDNTKNAVFVLSPTEYTNSIKEAFILDSKGEYVQAMPIWQKIYEKNANYQAALSGIGMGYYKQEEYRTAMRYFSLSEDREKYDMAYSAFRIEFMRKNFIFFALGAVVLFVLLIVKLNNIKKRGGKDETMD
ncbi:MAG: hypothetical protein E7480_04700 [Ruminococcaceae bacterium]|nr:hypothetical protein [Oscillospiraceae bacterium]